MNSRALRHWRRLMLNDETGERKVSGCYILEDTKCWEKKLQGKAVNQINVINKQNCITSLEASQMQKKTKNFNHDKLQTLTQLY